MWPYCRSLSKEQISGMEQLSERLNAKDLEINEVKASLEKATADKDSAIAEANLKNRTQGCTQSAPTTCKPQGQGCGGKGN